MRSLLVAVLLLSACGAPSAPLALTRAALASSGWTPGDAPMTTARVAHTATTLVHTDPGIVDAMGQVLVVGGYDATSTPLATSEAYHPSTSGWVAGPSLANPRAWHAAVLLGDYTVLVAGSITAAAARSVERFDPNRPSLGWVAQPPLNDGRALFTATLLDDGTVLLAGGYDCAAGCIARASAERYSPHDPTATPPASIAATGSLSVARIGHSATRLPDGRVLVVGGLGADLATTLVSAELYDPATGSWRAAAPPSTGRYLHTATLTSSHDVTRVLVTGGFSCGAGGCLPTADAEQYDPDADAWLPAPALTTERAGHTVTAQERFCRLTAAGGEDATSSPTLTTDHAPVAAAFSAASPLSSARYLHTANELADGRILVAGGYDATWSASASWETSYLYDGSACSLGVPSCAMPNDCLDSDGDGLSDVWETTGIDIDCDGVVDLDLRALGASPTHKDIFLQVDWMQGDGLHTGAHSHRPSDGVLSQVVDAFAAAPVLNPDGTSGVRLHVIMGSAIPDFPTVSFGACDPAAVDADMADVQRQFFPAARRPAFHYALFAHYTCDDYQFNGGFAQYPGNSLSINGFTGSGPADDALLTRRLLHELGHNLGLSHSGHALPLEYPGDNDPNYQSVMGRGAAAGPIDFSRTTLAALDENNLNEAAGTGAAGGTISFNCPGARCPGDGAARCPTVAQPGPVDWNCNGVIDATPVSADIDGDGRLSVLAGYDDWSQLVYGFQCSPSQVQLP